MKRGDDNRWADEDDDDEDGREDGELAADAQAPNAKRQRHEPIVWAARAGEKQPGRSAGSGAGGGPQREPHMEKVESTTGLAGLAGSGAGSPAAGPSPGGPARPRSAAELIAAEAEDFRRRTALEDDIDPAAPPAMRASPSGSDDGGKTSMPSKPNPPDATQRSNIVVRLQGCSLSSPCQKSDPKHLLCQHRTCMSFLE